MAENDYKIKIESANIAKITLKIAGSKKKKKATKKTDQFVNKLS